MKIGVYQGPSPKGNIEHAFSAVETALSAVSIAGAELIIFPELFFPGYNQPEMHHSIAQHTADPWYRPLGEVARTNRCVLASGWVERDGDVIYNSASCFDMQGQKAAHYRKVQLFGQLEKSTFAYGNEYRIFCFNGYRTALLICYDVEFAHHVQALRDQGVELLLVPTANPYQYEYVPDTIVPARAAEFGITIAYANYCGSENDLIYGGKSVIAGPDSVVLAKAGRGEALLVADLKIIESIDDAVLSTQHQDRRKLSTQM